MVRPLTDGIVQSQTPFRMLISEVRRRGLIVIVAGHFSKQLCIAFLKLAKKLEINDQGLNGTSIYRWNSTVTDTISDTDLQLQKLAECKVFDIAVIVGAVILALGMGRFSPLYLISHLFRCTFRIRQRFNRFSRKEESHRAGT